MRLLALQAAEVEPIGAEEQVRERQHECGNLPSEMLVRDVGDLREARADHVIRKRPEIAVCPDVPERLSFGERDDDGHRKSIRGKVDAGYQREHKRLTELRAVQEWRAINDAR